MVERIFRASAPGRVNLIGEHTDYNGGFVLPTAIPQRTHIEVSLRPDRKVVLESANFEGESEHVSYSLGEESPRHHWSDYIAGITWALTDARLPIGGFNAKVKSDIPMGAGLSSSAALLVATLRVLREAFSLPLNDVEIALMSQRVENNFVGAKVGIMDQMASSLSDSENALFLDTRHLNYERVHLPTDKAEIFIINSGIKHSNVHGDYNRRRAECEEASQRLGVKELRDVESVAAVEGLPDIVKRRARHVISENARVLEAVEALKAKDVKRLGRLMVASHHSMRDDFQISIPEIDLLVETALAHKEVFGARLTGGGFGGSIVGIAEPGTAKRVASIIADEFIKKTSCKAAVLVP